MDWLPEWPPHQSYPYVLPEEDHSRDSNQGVEAAPEDKVSFWRNLIRQAREPYSIFHALMPTFTGGVAACSIVWALVTPEPVAIALGVIGFVFVVITIRLFAIGGD